MSKSVLTLLFLFALSISAFSFENTSAELNISKQELSRLAKDPAWLDLLHFHQIGVLSHFESQIDSPSFFLSKQGKKNPEAELMATLKAFIASDNSENSVVCNYPARLHWLNSNKILLKQNTSNCKEFNDWYKKIDANSLTLAFPAAYLNSPSSMYGHTFIRINRKSGKNALLDYSINFSANVDPDDNELTFSFKGLSGGYPGVFSVLPYYEKVSEYSYLESRDVWEYDLNLTDTEVAQFIRHVWELRNSYLDYYFLNENCSYQLLTLLDASSDRFNLSKQFYFSAIPSDTVRAIKEAKLIKSVKFRPSTLTIMSNMLNQSSDTIKRLSKAMVVSEEFPATEYIDNISKTSDELEQAKVLDLAYQYSRYLSVRKKQDQQKQAKRSLSLLSARSKLSEEQAFISPAQPKYRDDEGHHSSRLEISQGQLNKEEFTQIGLRMTYHDTLDNISGYIKGSTLEMLHIKFRHSDISSSKSSSFIQEFKIIDIASYSPRNDFLTPLSWEVSTGLKRPISQNDELVTYLSAGLGVSYMYSYQQFYAIGFFDFFFDNDIEENHHISIGPKLGWLSQHENWSLNLEIKPTLNISGVKYNLNSAKLIISRSIQRDWQVRLSGEYANFKQNAYKNAHTHEFSLSLMHYF